MAKQKHGLGRGLSALLGEEADQFRKPVGYVNKDVVGTKPNVRTSDVLRIPIDMVEANPFQPRTSFDAEAMEELAASIKTLGLIQPITVRKVSENRYQIISGERRFKACRIAGMSMIPAYVRETDDQGMLEMALVENIQREDLDPIETALSYKRLMDECKLTQDIMADRVGKKRSSVANMLRLLKLPVKVQHDLKVGLLSVGHAKVLLGIEDAEMQQQFCDLVVKEGLSVRDLEKEVKKYLRKPSKKSPRAQQELPQEYTQLLSRIGRFFESDISLKRSAAGKGTMTIHFASDEEVQKFVKALEDAGI
ncbi:MAG TPA: ParB/RepB/Spo0J family partition protein [Candidatus Cryptobacteroides sp.]|jgi:ParB family chromosome partitioning protein|nr:ParB/RepB/Spo0J family partition protein [Candidatus Cryptobacteroides sp.]